MEGGEHGQPVNRAITSQPGREAVHVPFEQSLKALLANKEHRNIGEQNDTWHIWQYMLDKGSELGIAGRTEEAELYLDTGRALGIVAYPTLPPLEKRIVRSMLKRNIRSGRPTTFKLPEPGRKALAMITSVLGLEYNPQQEEFSYDTVLSQPEVSEEEFRRYYEGNK